MPDVIYIHKPSDGDGPTGVIFTRDTRAVYTGTGIVTERSEPVVEEVSRLCGIRFFLGEAPEAPFYSVPYLEVFASDGRGGWFASTTESTGGPVYYIAPDRTAHLVTDCYRRLFDLTVPDPDWRQKILPGDWPRLPEDRSGRRKLAELLRLPSSPPEEPPTPDAPPRLFPSRAEAEKVFPIRDIWTILRREKTPRFQVHPMMSPQDREGRALVHYQAWRETYAGLMPESVLAAHTLEHCRERAGDRRSNSANTFVALDRENGDQVVGFATLYRRARDFVSVPDAGEIGALYVLREFQGQGIGRDLLVRCLAWLPRPRVALFVLKGNDGAIGFYEHMGFRLTGQEIAQNGLTELEMALEKGAGR